jgi:hypothetical protein
MGSGRLDHKEITVKKIVSVIAVVLTAVVFGLVLTSSEGSNPEGPSDPLTACQAALRGFDPATYTGSKDERLPGCEGLSQDEYEELAMSWAMGR